MNYIKILVVLQFMFSMTLPEEIDSKGKDLLNEAKNIEKNATTTIKEQLLEDASPSSQATIHKIIYYKKTSSDGVSLSRIEYFDGKTIKSIKIRNRQGSFDLKVNQNIAIKMKFLNDKSNSGYHKKNYSKAPLKYSYNLEEVALEGVQYYVVTESLDKESYDRFSNDVFESVSNKDTSSRRQITKEKVSNILPIMTKYYIDKTSKFIKITEEYAESGTLISKDNFSLVKLNVPISDDLFDVPKHFQTKTVLTIEEYTKASISSTKQ